MAVSWKSVPYNGRMVEAPISPYPDTPCPKGTDKIRLVKIDHDKSDEWTSCTF